MSIVAELRVESLDGATTEEVEAAALQLRSELLNTDVDSVDFAEHEAPDGAKGVALGLTELVVTLAASGSALSVALQVVQDWLARRGREQAVIIKIGEDSLQLDNVSETEKQELVAAFLERNLGR